MRTAAREESLHDEIARLAQALCVACARLHARGLLSGAEGNLSVRLSNGNLLITPSGVDKATMSPNSVISLNADGTLRHAAGTINDSARDTVHRPSSEVGLHVACYAARPDARAVIHAHPPVATGFATAGCPIPADVLPEVPVVIGPIALVPYARPGTPALAEAMQLFLADHEVFLLANHGVTVLGTSLSDAMLRMESVEQAARIVLVARLLGGEQRLSAAETSALFALRPSSATSVTFATTARRPYFAGVSPEGLT